MTEDARVGAPEDKGETYAQPVIPRVTPAELSAVGED